MSESDVDTSEVTETETEDTQEQPKKPSDTVDFWKQKAREQEARAKSNAAAAKKLGELEDKTAERIAKAESEAASVPTKVAEGLKAHLVALHGIDTEDAELFLTATDPELLLKQVSRLLAGSDKRRTKNHVAREGENPTATTSEDAQFLGALFGSDG